MLQVHAGSAKAGVDNITKALSVELGPQGIRVNGIVPGYIEGTEGMDRLSPKDAKGFNIAECVPLQRMGRKDDVSNVALFLVSDAASYISGANITVDGGAQYTFPNFTLLSPDVQKIWRAKL